jgi:hypothetical protein
MRGERLKMGLLEWLGFAPAAQPTPPTVAATTPIISAPPTLNAPVILPTVNPTASADLPTVIPKEALISQPETVAAQSAPVITSSETELATADDPQ